MYDSVRPRPIYLCGLCAGRKKWQRMTAIILTIAIVVTTITLTISTITIDQQRRWHLFGRDGGGDAHR